MKRLFTYILIPMLLVLGACFDEQEFIISDRFRYVAFESSRVDILEGDVATLEVKVIYSGAALDSDLSIPLDISFPEGNAAQDGVDFVIEGGIDGVTVPAGEFSTTISISILDNDEPVGIRSLTLGINEIPTFNLGAPDAEDTQSVTVNILEDDLILFGFTGFEEPAAGDVNNYPAQEGIVQVNIPGENSVDYTSTGGEMGFNSDYVEGQAGGADSGLLFGVTKFTADPDWGYDTGGFIDGAQAYSTSDADGLMEIVFDELTIPDGTGLLQVSLWLWFADASWEEDDEFDVIWRTEDGDELILSLRSDGSSMTDSPDGSGNTIVNQWTSFIVTVENIKTGSLVIQIGTDSGSEINFIDSITIEGV